MPKSRQRLQERVFCDRGVDLCCIGGAFAQHEEIYSHEDTSSGVAADFGQPDRNNTGNDSDTHAGNDTSAAHPCNVIGRCLEDGTEQIPQSSENSGLNAAYAISERISERTSNKGANQGASVVDGDDLT